MKMNELRREHDRRQAQRVEAEVDRTVHLYPPIIPLQQQHRTRVVGGCHMALVEDEMTGKVEYKIFYPDGHLGSVED